MEGWIKIHRKLLEWEWYDDHKMLVVFLHCLLKANHKEIKWRGITIKKGEFLTGRERLADEVKLSIQQVRSCLQKLEKSGQITIKTTTLGTRISINNYYRYQDTNSEFNQPFNQQITSDQPANNQQITTNKNDNNDNNDKEGGEPVVSKIPTLSQVKEYFEKNRYSEEAAIKAFNTYQASIEDHPRREYWRDTRDNRIKNWKMKMQSVWFKDENLINDSDSFDPEYAKLHLGGEI